MEREWSGQGVERSRQGAGREREWNGNGAGREWEQNGNGAVRRGKGAGREPTAAAVPGERLGPGTSNQPRRSRWQHSTGSAAIAHRGTNINPDSSTQSWAEAAASRAPRARVSANAER